MNKEIEELKQEIKDVAKNQMDTMAHKIDKIYDAIYGNGKAGILTKVSNLELITKIMAWCIGVIYTAGITWIVCAFLDLIKDK